MDLTGRKLARVPPDRFIGRAAVLALLEEQCTHGGIVGVRYAPSCGGPELLRQLNDRLLERGEFRVRYLSLDPADDVARLIDALSGLDDERTVIIVDAMHKAAEMTDGDRLLSALKGRFSRGENRVICGGLRRFSGFDRFRAIHVDRLDTATGAAVARATAEQYGIDFNREACDLAALQLGGRPGAIMSVVSALAASGLSLDSFASFERAYTDELFGTSIGRAIDQLLNRIMPDITLEARVFRLIAECLSDGPASLMEWQAQAGAAPSEFRRIVELLRLHEIINVGAGRLHVDVDDVAVTDYIRGRARLEIDGSPRAFVIAETVAANIERAPRLMSRYYRQTAAVGLKNLLGSFQGQSVASAAIDYAKFAAEFKGHERDEQLAKLAVTDDIMPLPRIVFSAATGYIYPPFAEIAESERSAVAYSSDGTIWLAAEIDSKLAAETQITEYWLDRLEAAALHCGFDDYRLWLVSREGFTEDALAAIAERDAIGTSHAQIDLLRISMGAAVVAPAYAELRYQLEIPMASDSEFVAAKAVEEIAQKAGFARKAINQIKTALVEACINANEHSLSPDRRIRLTFTVSGDAIEVAVENRGLRLRDRMPAEADAGHTEQRRGWGLQLISKLMDDVSIETVDDGTRIVMKKCLN